MSDEAFPTVGRLAGIDYGTVRVGIAVSDPERTLTSPFDTYTRRGEQADADYFRQFAAEERIVGFVVGLPVHLSGEESVKSREARRFGGWLQKVTGLPVCFHDERFSTTEAASLLAGTPFRKRKHRALRDKLAAQIILSSFLEGGAREAPRGLDD